MVLNSNAEIIKGEKNVFTHMVIAAHQDDVEIMCGDGIVQCYNKNDKGLVAVIVSDGAGSPRNGEFENFSNEQMIEQRKKEQIAASKLGQYARTIFLNYKSNEINSMKETVKKDLYSIILHYKPEILYTHNPADKHRTHIGVLKNTLKALEEISEKNLPKKLFGCECWRDLDWLCDNEKEVFDLTGYGELLTEMLSTHKSQIAGGKRYDLAVDGRRKANATFYRSHNVDSISLASYGMDMSELMKKNSSLQEFIFEKIDNFKNSVRDNL